MYAIDLGGGAELRPLEPWQAAEFLEHMERARESVDLWIPWASVSTDLESATATLRRYADLAARDAGRLCGIWLDGTLVGGTMFASFDAAAGNCEVGMVGSRGGVDRGGRTAGGRMTP
jgi:ribosomal-protein-serine acetyltransferase